MEFVPSSDQEVVLGAIDALAKPFSTIPPECHEFSLYSSALDDALAEGDFFDAAAIPELGPITAALIVERIAVLPYCTEIAASALIRPILCPDLPRPLCVMRASDLHRPVRFLSQAASVLIVDGSAVSSASVANGSVTAVDSLFAYPMGRFAEGQMPSGATARVDIPADQFLCWWRLALAAEIAGLLKAALESTIAHVRDREQFGRPIGSFQAVRHRLAEAAVKATGSRLLAHKAASTGDPADAALAAYHAQDVATAVVYDLHQFLGAMGLTLEHPLHFWTYRLKALLSELGGRGAHVETASAVLGTA